MATNEVVGISPVPTESDDVHRVETPTVQQELTLDEIDKLDPSRLYLLKFGNK